MSIIAWIVLGLISGYIGSLIVHKKGKGLWLNMAFGIVGAIVGGLISSAWGFSEFTGVNLYSMIVAIMGSVVVLWVYHAVSPPSTAPSAPKSAHQDDRPRDRVLSKANYRKPAKIYICYRREDDPAAAGRVHEHLAKRFGDANLFIDVNNLIAGQSFEDELANALAACDVLIAIIGPRWMEMLKAKSASRERDYVREEIAAALQRKIIVMPVRVGLADRLPPLPRAEDLPGDISGLLKYQKHDVAFERFGHDLAGLCDAIISVRQGAHNYS